MKLALFSLFVGAAVFAAPAEKKLIYISVTNGGPFGNWGTIGVCPEGSKAVGFSLKVQDHVLIGDNTAMNGIRLHCFDSVLKNETVIESVPQQVLPDQGDNVDDSAANNIQFKCSSGEVLNGAGLSYGSWGNWSAECTTGICGLQTKVESDLGLLDDTALNDVQFFCC